MSRINIFHLLNKGLKASLHHTALQIQQTNFAAEEEAAETVGRVLELIMIFEVRANQLQKHLYPEISIFEPSVTATLIGEADKEKELIRELQLWADRNIGCSDGAEKLRTSDEIEKAFHAFFLFELADLAWREKLINDILWRYYKDEEIMLLSEAMRRDMDPWIEDFFATWILKGINNSELTEWLFAVKRTMPATAYKCMQQKLLREFPVSRMVKLNDALKHAALVSAN